MYIYIIYIYIYIYTFCAYIQSKLYSRNNNFDHRNYIIRTSVFCPRTPQLTPVARLYYLRSPALIPPYPGTTIPSYPSSNTLVPRVTPKLNPFTPKLYHLYSGIKPFLPRN